MFYNKNENYKSDEMVVSPFTELGYILNDVESDSFRFAVGNKITLSPEVVVWSMVKFLFKHVSYVW